MSGPAAPRSNPAPQWSDRVGLGDGPSDPRLAWRLLVLICAVYVVGFALFYPRDISNDDEAQYLRQTQLILSGRSTVTKTDALTGEQEEVFLSTYPLGTALLMAAPVFVAGWRGGFVVPCVALVAAVLLTALWLRDERRSPLFAVLLLGFPPALVMGRVAMSDVPSAALVALGLWLFWRGLERGAGWWLASGFLAGASLTLRVSNPLVFAPLFAGTVLRRERRCWALVVGGLAGLGLRFLTMRFYFGDVLYERSNYFLAVESVMERLPLYLLGLLVFVPGGLLLALAYRGRRRPEIVVTVVLFFCFYLFQTYSTVETGFAKRIVLALRYFIPLLPLLAFAMAESAPRLWRAWRERWSRDRRQRIRATATAALAIWLAGIGVAAFAVHPAMALWGRTQGQLREAIERHVPLDGVMVTNWWATRKLIREMERSYKTISRERVDADQIRDLARRYGAVYVVLVDRSDSEFWRGDRLENQQFADALHPPVTLLVDLEATPTDRLRIWKLESDGAVDPGNDG